MKVSIVLLSLLFAFTAFAGEVTIHGSTSMLEINQRLRGEFETTHAGIKVSVVGSDSGQGIADLLRGSAMLAASSRPIKDAEVTRFREAGKPLIVFPVARDGVAVYVHVDNRVRTLTIAQLAGIFSGRITNWKEFGGDSAPIHVYIREASSGTQQFFREKVMEGASYAGGAKELLSTSEMMRAVAADKNGIGYASFVFTNSVQTVALQTAAGAPAQKPTREAVVAGTYPLSRIFYYVAAGTPSGDLMTFIQWALSPKGQQTVAKAGFYQLK